MPATNRAFIAQKHFVADAIELFQGDGEGLDRNILSNGQIGSDSGDEDNNYNHKSGISDLSPQMKSPDKSPQQKFVENYDLPEFLWDIE